MVTIKDIAKEAGVSHGTVSNVLNKTGKVSSEKIRRVEEAAKRLGYKANIQAQMLKLGGGKNVALVLPSIQLKHFFSVYDALRTELEKSEINLLLYITEDLESSEQNALDRIYETRPSIIISCSSMKYSASYLADCPVIFIDRFFQKDRDNAFSAGFSYYRAGKEIGEYLCRENRKNIAIFSQSAQSYDCTQFILGLSDILDRSANVERYRSDIKLMMGKAMQLASEADRYDAIITMDYNRAQALKYANNYTKTNRFPEIICITDNSMFEDSDITLYHLDYGKLGRNLAAMVAAYLKNSNPLHDLMLENTGFIEHPSFTRKDGETLSVLTLESPASNALSRLLPKFTEDTGITVEMICLPYDELYHLVRNETDASSHYDLIRLDMAWLPEVAENLLLPLDSIDDLHSIESSFIPELSHEYTSVGNISYALPFDPSVQILFYNTDAFDNSIAQRMYFEKYREKLEVPKTFREHDRIAQFFTRSFNPESPIEYGTAITCGTSGVAACDFIPRLTENENTIDMVRLFRDNRTIEALDQYKASFRYTDENINTWWNNSIESFSNGNCAMLTVFMNHASQMTNSKHSKIIGKVGFAQVPGGHPLLGGGTIGIGKKSSKTESAVQFLKWVYCDEIARLYTYFGGISPNAVVYEDPEILNIYPWLSIARESFKEGKRRFENADEAKKQKEFEDMLGIAVRDSVLSASNGKEALDKAASKIESTYKY